MQIRPMKNVFLISISIWMLGISGCKKDNIKDNTIQTVPVLSTVSISNITETTASGGGSVNSDGGGAVTARGVCWSTHTQPTVSDSKTSDGTGTGSFSSTLTGLSNTTTYYIRAYATNSIGTGYGNELSFTTSAPAFTIGQTYGGGKIFYIDGTGIHGLIVSAADVNLKGTSSTTSLISSLGQNALVPWGCLNTNITGADGSAIGTGQQNTIDILAGCSTSGTAAYICANLVLNGYTDWFLPSKDEIYQLYLQRATIGGLAGQYWSSTEYNYQQAWWQGFDAANGQQVWYKDEGMRVRAVRAF
jgi:hypothetical protein